MDFKPEKIEAGIIFNNEPRLSEHEADKELNTKRLELVPVVRDFISTHERFQGQSVTVTFNNTGIASLVSIIETPNDKTVLKIPLDPKCEGEALFLKAWNELGVTVPKVINDGLIAGNHYILMDYIQAEILRDSNTYEQLVKKGTFTEMGRILRRMHMPRAEGFGRITNGKAKYVEFRDWLESDYIAKNIRYVRENGVLSDEHGSIQTAFETLLSHMRGSATSTYCHNDFFPNNIFDTDPLTIFDPDPSLNDGYIDLGRSIIMAVGYGGLPEAGTQLTKGYFDDESFDQSTLRSAILLNSHLKVARWHKVKNFKNITNIQRYLMQ